MKKLLRLLLLILTLSTLSVSSVFADELKDNGSSTNTGDTGSAKGKTTYTYARSGFILYIVDQSGNLKTDGVLIRSGLPNDEATSGWKYNGQNIMMNGIVSRIGGMSYADGSIKEETGYNASSFWDLPPFTSGGSANGTAIKNWLVAPGRDASFEYNAVEVITRLFEYNDAQMSEFYTNNDILVVEPYLWSGMYIGDNYLGLMAGTAYGWAKVWEPGHTGAGGAFQKLPKSAYLVESWAGVQAPTVIPSDQVSKAFMLDYGFGMLMVSGKSLDKAVTHTWDYSKTNTPSPAPNPNKPGYTKNIVKVYRTVDTTTGTVTWDGAFYTPGAGSTIVIEDEPDYKVVDWQTSVPLCPTTSPDATYPQVTDNSTHTQTGTTTGTVELSDSETTLYVLLERSNTPTAGGGSSISDETDVIRANELNYIFANFSGSRTGSKAGFDVKSIRWYDHWIYMGYNGWYDGSNVTINESISGDVTNFNGAKSYLQNAIYTLWNKFSVSKVFPTSSVITPQYSYISSRGMWQDNLVLSNYRNKKELGTAYTGYKTWISEYLKLNEGDKGTVTPLTAGNGVEGTIGGKSDSYTFSGVDTEYYEYNCGSCQSSSSYSDENGESTEYWCPGHEGSNTYGWDTTYNVAHSVEKYKAPTSSVIGNSKSGQTAYKSTSTVAGENVYMKQAFASQASSQMNVYPEVEMKFWMNQGTDGIYNNPLSQKIYVMGERVRSANPAMLHGYTAGYSGAGNKPRGITTLPSASTGTNASNAANNFGDDSINGVTAQGTTFETATTNNPVVVLYSFALDVKDSVEGIPVRNDWSNAGYNPANAHNEYVEGVKNGVVAEVYMKNFDKGGTAVSDWYKMQTDISNISVSTTETDTIDIIYKAGQIMNKQDILNKIISAYSVSTSDANTIFDGWGLESQLDAMFTSKTDSGNNSSNKWYDEESITMCIRYYRTALTFGKMMFDDKMDYNLLSQTSTNRLKNGTEAIEARFFLKLKFDVPTLSVDGVSIATSNSNLRFDEIDGTRFLVANLTTTSGKK